MDFDGVVNRHGQRFDPAAVTRLNQITDATGAVLVISSSWREVHPDPEDTTHCTAPMSTQTTAGEPATLRCQACTGCQETTLAILGSLLTAHGVTAPVIGLTPSSYGGGPRGREISAWLEDHKEVASYVILDDTDDCQTDSLVRLSGEALVDLKRLFRDVMGRELVDEFESFGRDRLVLTTWVHGLQDEHVAQAIALLLIPITTPTYVAKL